LKGASPIFRLSTQRGDAQRGRFYETEALVRVDDGSSYEAPGHNAATRLSRFPLLAETEAAHRAKAYCQ